MANYNQNDSNNYDKGKGETVFANHKLEFMRFFEKHKNLCDEISGLKYHHISSIDGGHKIIISKVNFDYALKKLNSFINDFLYSIEEHAKRCYVEKKFYELENTFLNDVDYANFCKRHDNLTVLQNISFNRKYINYLVWAFDVSHIMSGYLQKSLNIASKEIIKSIHFVNYDGFYNNLSAYKEEVSNDLSNLKYETLFDNFKKMMGFYYTYRYLMMSREQKHIDDLLLLIHKYIIDDETVKNIMRLKEGSGMSKTLSNSLKEEFQMIRNCFNKIYFLCNFSLSMKKILPKSRVDILIDTTLI